MHDWPVLSPDAPCPFCRELPPDDSYSVHVQTLSVSTLRLERNQAYPGSALVILTTGHAERLSQLDDDTARAFYEDMLTASRAIEAVFSPDHVNAVLLGNVVRHLHWIIVPRYRTDARWGRPIWTTDRREMPVAELDPAEYADICRRLRAAMTRSRKEPNRDASDS